MPNDFYCDEALSGNTRVNIIMETENVLAFHHTKPFWPVHIVVIPKQHIPSLTDLGEYPISLVHTVFDAVRAIAARIEKTHGACRIVTNVGHYQDSKHLHFHIAHGDPLADE